MFFGSLRKIDLLIEKISSYLLVATIMMILAFSVFSIVARWTQTTVQWIEPLVRHLVFFSTYLGGILATGRGTHIAIDILSKYLETKRDRFNVVYRALRLIVAFVSFATLIWLTYASWKFVQVELEFGKEAFLGIHSGYLVAMIPFGFGIIAYRFFVLFLAALLGIEILPSAEAHAGEAGHV